MVDRLARTQLVPVVHRRAPRRSLALSSAQRADGAGGACGPTGASVSASGSRRRLAQIQGADRLSAEQDIEAAILVGRPQRDPTAGEGPAELDRAVAQAQPAVRIDPAHDRLGTVVERLDLFRKRPRARAVARRGGRQIERLVRPLRVVHHPPFVKPALALAKTGKGAPADHLGYQGAMKPLVLALG